ncbi:YybH family protein [Pseudoalteromonas umbrosa]|uniref:YybH family protein n=1 Tax=Pseudoalteromonas umbrosa TaxID=3048489 RepID=UPI0024C284A5|nr:nuclear transport factor 2 family protein [Pseudoalteromonas sp. B95]MDK1288688.1 nuclear transport factor 2 family protein [Pseudoalteromonas sp. B95]
MNTHTTQLALCKAGISAWQQAFNRQDAQACAQQYTEHATMKASPFGEFTGREQIAQFWQDIMDQGFHSVDYSDVDWQPSPEGGYILTSKWTMNKAYGVVHKEHWVIEADGHARLIYDEFEVLGEK